MASISTPAPNGRAATAKYALPIHNSEKWLNHTIIQ